MPTALQLDPGLGLTAPPPIKVVPSISQIAAWPWLVFCQEDVGKAVAVEISRSAFQFGPGMGLTAPPPIAVPIHLPDRDLAWCSCSETGSSEKPSQ